MPASIILKQSIIARILRAARRAGFDRIVIDTATGKVSIFSRHADEETAADSDSQDLRTLL